MIPTKQNIFDVHDTEGQAGVSGPRDQLAAQCCGTCSLFKRSYPTSERLKEYGTCHWKFPARITLPNSWRKHPVKDFDGKDCKAWLQVDRGDAKNANSGEVE